MSTINKGFTFAHDVVGMMSATALHGLVDNATATNIGLTEFATSAHLVQVAASVPASDQGEGSFWFDSTLGILRSKNANRQDCPYVGPEMLNSTGSTIPQGAWVVANGSGTIAPCTTHAWPEVLGVLTATVVNGAKAVVRTKGIGLAMIVGPCTIGDVLISAGHVNPSYGDQRARSLHSSGLSTATLGVAIGQVFVQLGTTTGLATCMIWR